MKLRLDRSRVWKQIQEQQRPANLLIQSQLTQSKQLPNVGKFSLVTQSSFFLTPHSKKKKERQKHTHTHRHTQQTHARLHEPNESGIFWRSKQSGVTLPHVVHNETEGLTPSPPEWRRERMRIFYFLLEGWGGGSNGGMGGGGKKMKRRRKKRRRRKW